MTAPYPRETGLPLLTASRLRVARRCQREHRYRYVDLVRPVVEPEPLRFGRLFHRALEAWWRSTGTRYEDALAALCEAESEPMDRAKAAALIAGYDARWSAVPMRVRAVEATFRVPLRNPETGALSRTWELAGVVDAIIETADHRLMVVEHKTSSEDISAGSDYWKRLRMDEQISLYYVGAQALLGEAIHGCLYDVVRKPLLRPYKATPAEARKYTKDGRLYASQHAEDETPDEFGVRLVEDIATRPDEYYARGEVVRLEHEGRDALWDVWQTGRQLREAQLADRWPRNPDACVRWGRTCEYFPVCAGEASIDDPSLYQRIADPHPELADASE